MDRRSEYNVGKRIGTWRDEAAQTLTFIVTEDCNLRCKYCYVTHKESGKTMSFEIARKFIDLILKMEVKSPAVILDFIGGEPLLEAKLIDQICDYFKRRTYELHHKWYWNYRISIGTNGINYSDEKVQRLIEKNKGKISVSITLDGTKQKHDLQRVFPNGEGSYDAIMKNVPLWLSQFPGNTKVTFSSADLPFLKDSIIELWKMGIEEVAANVVFENVWESGDDKIFEKQLKELADYVIENDLYDKYKCTLFEDSIGTPYTEEDLCNTSCGAGKMLAVNYEGNIYPCVRYYDHSLNNKKGYIIGDVESGLIKNRLRVFGTLMNKYQCDSECVNCEVATGCSFCQGFCYDDADTPTNFQRAKYICKMHKARVRANNYYFARLENIKGIKRENPLEMKKTLFFLLGDDYISFCSYENKKEKSKYMEKDVIIRGLDFAERNFFKPIFVHSDSEDKFEWLELYNNFNILHILPIEDYINARIKGECIPIIREKDINIDLPKLSNAIFVLPQSQIQDLGEHVKGMLEKCERINIKITRQTEEFPYELYEEQLRHIKDIILEIYNKEHELREVNTITDILFMTCHESCGAGDKVLAFAPDGKFYICPAYYSEEETDVGNITDGIEIKNQHLYTNQYAPLCNCCDAYHCENCIFTNQKATFEVNVSPDFQCKKAHVERKISLELQSVLTGYEEFENFLKRVLHLDPYMRLESVGRDLGLYNSK